MTHKFYQLPIDALFTIIGDDPRRQWKKISDTRAIVRVHPQEEWNSSVQYPFRKDAEVFTLEGKPAYAWETFTIEITYAPGGGDNHLEQQRSDITERFESELFRLVKKYQGKAGLTFFATNSENEITEY